MELYARGRRAGVEGVRAAQGKNKSVYKRDDRERGVEDREVSKRAK